MVNRVKALIALPTPLLLGVTLLLAIAAAADVVVVVAVADT